MNLFTAFTISLSIFLIVGCGSSKKQTKKDSGASQGSDTVRTDTTAQLTPPPPGPAPGHVRINGKILSYVPKSDDQPFNLIKLKITAVEEYGSSTAALAVSDSIIIKTGDTIEAKIKNQIGKIVSAVLSYRQVPFSNKSVPSWYLVNLQVEK